MPKDKKNSLLLHSRKKYADLTPEERTALLLKLQDNYAAMTKDEKDTFLLHLREKYANLTPEEQTIKLRSRREKYGKIKCTIKREVLLAQMSKTTQRL